MVYSQYSWYISSLHSDTLLNVGTGHSKSKKRLVRNSRDSGKEERETNE